jgi:hypothetical protein
VGCDDEIQRITEIERVANGKPSHFNIDKAFCARIDAAIAAGLERPPTGVVATPGTKNPRFGIIARSKSDNRGEKGHPTWVA